MDIWGALLSIFFGLAPMLLFAYLIYWTDRFEKEPLILVVGVFLWGAIFAAGSAFIVNTVLGMGMYLFTQSESVTQLSTGSLFAPIVEETLKGFSVLVVFLVFRREFDSVLDGIVYAAISALGFAATENAYYIFTYGYLEGGISQLLWVTFVRVVLVGWQHPFYTSFIGIGLAIARLSRSQVVRYIAPLLGWLLAVTTHAFHNTFATFFGGLQGVALGAFFDWSGWLVMLLFMLWALYREKRWIATHLLEEVTLGTLTPRQYQVACSAWAQALARTQALFSSRYRLIRRFYQLTAELAHKKQQLLSLGDEGGNAAIIQAYRQELAHLSLLLRLT